MNRVILIGRLGSDPDVRKTPSGSSVLAISLATSRRWKDKTTGEKKDSTEWHRLVFWNRAAEIVGEYCKKGAQISVEGRIETRKWTDDKNIERYSTEIIVEHLELLGSAGGESGAGSTRPPLPENQPDNFEDFDDDLIPFDANL